MLRRAASISPNDGLRRAPPAVPPRCRRLTSVSSCSTPRLAARSTKRIRWESSSAPARAPGTPPVAAPHSAADGRISSWLLPRRIMRAAIFSACATMLARSSPTAPAVPAGVAASLERVCRQMSRWSEYQSVSRSPRASASATAWPASSTSKKRSSSSRSESCNDATKQRNSGNRDSTMYSMLARLPECAWNISCQLRISVSP
mmetsp:Transcript_5458/g.14397  ORF Transcript_5458/g.14397 Transcript_5458/m.14397 type:complete len:203 (-) Transcript_5458:223-831(-)